MRVITDLIEQWDALQPLTPEYQKRLDRKFMLDFNFNSNHIEGNTLTYGQTKLLLMFGETSGDAKLRDYEEMKAHNVGLELIKREAKDQDRPLTESFIRELNRTILVEDYTKRQTVAGKTTQYEIKVGRYKTRPNSVITVTDEMFDYASPEETPALMTDLILWYNQEEQKRTLTPIQLAALLHYRYIRIHPFEDGNGRIARLLMNYVMLRHGLPMIIVQSSDKENYLNVLHKCDVEVGLSPSDGANATLEQIQPFVEYIEKLCIHALEIAIKAAQGKDIEEADDWKKELEIKMREAKEAPLFSISSAQEIQEKTIHKLIYTIDKNLHAFESLFDKVNRLLINGNKTIFGSEIEQIKTIPTNYNYKAGFRFRASYIKSVLYTEKRFTYELKSMFQKREYNISIVVGDKEHTFNKKRYNEYISDNELADAVNFVGRLFTEFVKTNIITDQE